MSTELKVNAPKTAGIDAAAAAERATSQIKFDIPNAAKGQIPEANYGKSLKDVLKSSEEGVEDKVGAFKKAVNWMKKPFVDGAAYKSKIGRVSAGGARVAIVAVPTYIAAKALFGGKSEPQEGYTYPANENTTPREGGFAAAEEERRAEASSAEMAL